HAASDPMGGDALIWRTCLPVARGRGNFFRRLAAHRNQRGGVAIRVAVATRRTRTDLPARSRPICRLSPASTPAVEPRAVPARVLARGSARHSARSDYGTLSADGRDRHTSL